MASVGRAAAEIVRVPAPWKGSGYEAEEWGLRRRDLAKERPWVVAMEMASGITEISIGVREIFR